MKSLPGKEVSFRVESAPARLDRFLADRLPDYTRAYLKKLIEQGAVLVDGRARGPDHRLSGGELVELRFPSGLWPGSDLFERWVIREDKHLLILNKPAGLLMHPLGESWLKSPAAALAGEEPNLAGLLQKARPEVLGAGMQRCGLIHRLDRQTSGVLAVAKTPESQLAMIDAFKGRRVSKTYRAIVRGVPKERAPRVFAPIGRKPGHRKMVVTEYGKEAETAFRVIESSPNAALVEARPLTGRTHQIRAHLAFLGHPVAGDAEFEERKSSAFPPPRLMLHAYRLQFEHPATGKPASFIAPLPADFKDYWGKCRAREETRP